jgi:hypothetical protein
LVALLVFLLISAGSAQEAAPAPKAGPEHEKLAYFVGTWNSEAEIKPTSFGRAADTAPRKPASGFLS